LWGMTSRDWTTRHQIKQWCQQRQLQGRRNRRRNLLEIDQSINQTINHFFIVRPDVDQRAGQLSLPHVGLTKTERKRIKNFNSMSSSYNTPFRKHKLVVSICSNTETSLAMSTLAIWCCVLRSRDFSPPPKTYLFRKSYPPP